MWNIVQFIRLFWAITKGCSFWLLLLLTLPFPLGIVAFGGLNRLSFILALYDYCSVNYLSITEALPLTALSWTRKHSGGDLLPDGRSTVPAYMPDKSELNTIQLLPQEVPWRVLTFYFPSRRGRC